MKTYSPRKKTLQKINCIKEAYKVEGRMTLRRIYYILLSKRLLKHSKGSYAGLSKLMTKLREEGLIDPHIIVDRHREVIQRTTYSNFEEAISELCESYVRNSMLQQDRYVEVWIEKDTMQHIFLNDCFFKDVPLVVSKGFTSYTFKHEALERFEDMGKPITILYFGDFDCEGEYIPKVFKNFIMEKNSDLDIEFKKILLTIEDIEKLKEFGVEDEGLTKKEHLRKEYVKDFISKYGKIKYEVEAMPFNEVKERFVKALAKEINFDIVKQNKKESEEEAKEWLQTKLGEDFYG